ncbi:MAG: uracil-DNA glycosylase [Candidatus Cloacimonetes bacterium]|nr:uracil-DNA glycosylase [Candidatus Cloacimonadota bacterium]MDD4155688.1 uracil-DNA glycosylase [Candidatus Cloacimonadota bacterium]
MALRAFKQYIESYLISGISDIFTESDTFNLNIKIDKKNNIINDSDLPIFKCAETEIISKIDNDIIDLNLLKRKYADCKNCEYHTNRIKFVYGEGPQKADVFIIGNPPNADENITGRPFCGKEGVLLNNMLKAINLSRNDVYITNICKCKANNNQDYTQIKNCLSYLNQQIKIVSPKIILIFGEVAAQSFLNNHQNMNLLRQNNPYKFNNVPVFVTYGTTKLNNNISLKKLTWIDLQNFRDTYHNLIKE